MPAEPLRRNSGRCFEGSRLFEKMSRTGNNDQFLVRASEVCQRVTIHRDDWSVIASHYQERRCTDNLERTTSEIGPPAPGDDRGNNRWEFGPGHERRSRPSAGPLASTEHAGATGSDFAGSGPPPISSR